MTADRLRVLSLILVALPLSAGCGSGREEHPTRKAVVDEVKGTYRGVGLGDSVTEVRARFGRPAPFDPDEGTAPVDADPSAIGGPPTITPPGPLTLEAAKTDHTFRYRGVSFSAIRRRVYAVLVTTSGAQTRRGVAIGDEVGAVRDEYPHADCEGPEGGLTSERDYPLCSVHVAPGRYLFFSHDPISDITMTTKGG